MEVWTRAWSPRIAKRAGEKIEREEKIRKWFVHRIKPYAPTDRLSTKDLTLLALIFGGGQF